MQGPMQPLSTSSVIVIGAGCMGLSTALHLRRRGISVTLLDKYPCPSPAAASNDSSRIVRADYSDPFYASLGWEALEAWKTDSVFSSAFHHTGWIFAALTGNDFVRKSYEILKSMGKADCIEMLDSKGVEKKFPGLNGPMANWNMYFNTEAGWADARLALISAMDEFVRLGGKFFSGDEGEVVSTVLIPNTQAIAGVLTHSGGIHEAPQVLYATGAFTPHLLDTGLQIHPLGFCVAHWQLSPEETNIWRDHPVVDLNKNGYFFPPNDNGVMKMGVGLSAFSNIQNSGLGTSSKLSVPRTVADYPSDGIPKEAEEGVRQILRQAAPSLADKEFFDMKVCWDGMTAVSSYLIAPHPDASGLYVAAGGSGHAFKFFPIIGRYISDMLAGTLEKTFVQKWAWKETTTENPGGCISGRPVKDLKDALNADRVSMDLRDEESRLSSRL